MKRGDNAQLRVSVESQSRLEIYSAKCFLEVINGVSGNNRIRKFISVTHDHNCGEWAVVDVSSD